MQMRCAVMKLGIFEQSKIILVVFGVFCCFSKRFPLDFPLAGEKFNCTIFLPPKQMTIFPKTWFVSFFIFHFCFSNFYRTRWIFKSTTIFGAITYRAFNGNLVGINFGKNCNFMSHNFPRYFSFNFGQCYRWQETGHKDNKVLNSLKPFYPNVISFMKSRRWVLSRSVLTGMDWGCKQGLS